MFTEKVDVGIAKNEVEAWLNNKKVSAKKRSLQRASIETLIDAVQYGVISINHESMVITHTLNFPIKDTDGEVSLSELVFKPRTDVSEIKLRTKGLDPSDDGTGRLSAVAAALTGKAVGLIEKLDTEDTTIVQAIAIFFI
jgi:hypothetical protein